MTTPTAKFSTILTEITIDHGPEELLVQLFLRLEHAVRLLGLRLSFGSLTSLSAINAANRASWMPLFPVYRPDYWPHTPSDAFVLLASEPDGRPIATLAVRIYDWPSSTFHAEATSLRLFYGDVERFRGRGERCEVSAGATHKVTGRVALAGAVWVHPDWRKHARLMVLMPRFARAYALARWGVDFYTLLMTEAVFNGGLTRKTGCELSAQSTRALRPAEAPPLDDARRDRMKQIADRVSSGIDPLYVGKLVREGIENDWPYIFTDCEFEPMIEARFSEIKRGFDRIRDRNARR